MVQIQVSGIMWGPHVEMDIMYAWFPVPSLNFQTYPPPKFQTPSNTNMEIARDTQSWVGVDWGIGSNIPSSLSPSTIITLISSICIIVSLGTLWGSEEVPLGAPSSTGGGRGSSVSSVTDTLLSAENRGEEYYTFLYSTFRPKYLQLKFV